MCEYLTLSGPGVVDSFFRECFGYFDPCDQVVSLPGFGLTSVQRLQNFFAFAQIVLVTLLDEALVSCKIFFLIVFCTAYKVTDGDICSATLHPEAELQGMSTLCVSVESVTEVFTLPAFCFAGLY